MVYKLPPYYPSAVGFGIRRRGVPAADRLRRGAGRGDLEGGRAAAGGVRRPVPAHRSRRPSRTLARHGIVSLLDFHQDLYNERFQGEGAPDWAVQDDGLPNPKLGFPGNYLGNPALERALDQFCAKTPPARRGMGCRIVFASAWAHVAARFRMTGSVLGYELFNEPFPGTAWELCIRPVRLPCVRLRADRALSPRRGGDPPGRPANADLVRAERAVQLRLATHVGALGDPHAGFAFHDYCLSEPQTGSPQGCDTFDDMVFSNALAQVAPDRRGADDDRVRVDHRHGLSRATCSSAPTGTWSPWLEWSYLQLRRTDRYRASARRSWSIPPRRRAGRT